MQSKTAQLRLEAFILKDKQSINGYRLARFNTNNDRYNVAIALIRKSIERKKEALEYLQMYPEGEFNWEALCKRFGFCAYRQVSFSR